MVNNLRAELVRKGISNGKIADEVVKVLGCTTKSARDKLNGKFSFTCREAFKIKESLFPDMTIDYLFMED